MKVKDGGAIRRRRLRRGLSQRELAYLVRCSQTTIYYLETGGMTTLSDDLALRVAKRLDVDLEDLFAERLSVPMSTLTTDQRVSGRGVA